MIPIDGMPIVSGLSTVYGLSGIPQSLIERLEIVKGPASTLYGSEAVGGLINVITKKPSTAPTLSADVFGTDWREINADLAGRFSAGKKAQSMLGVSYFNYQNPIDNNNDGFTNLTFSTGFRYLTNGILIEKTAGFSPWPDVMFMKTTGAGKWTDQKRPGRG